jgi:hypothetical protein
MHTIDAIRRPRPDTLGAPHRSWSAQAGQGLIEWEDVPSLAHRLRKALDTLDVEPGQRAAVWDATMPADLMPLEPETPAAPLRQVLDGLEMREVTGTELFRHFFGQH